MKRTLIGLLGALLTACGASDLSSTTEDAITARSAIKHLVVIVQENHSFDSYFGTWCAAPAGSSPTCTAGASCCEAAPAQDPWTGAAPVALTDWANSDYSPDHSQACEATEIDSGLMDGFVAASCGNRRNFALAGNEVALYRAWASRYAIADRYFQPIVGASSSNDMYFSVARALFVDNAWEPLAIGHGCAINRNTKQFVEVSIQDLLAARGFSSAWYAEGYQDMADAWLCPDAPRDCTSDSYFPCIYDPSDVPAAYFPSTADNPAHMKDYAQLGRDLKAGTLPAVSFVKGLTYRNEHPGYGTTISNGVQFVAQTVQEIEASKYGADTLVLVTWDESGGYFDHVTPPPASKADGQPYGPRVPLLALGPFARKGTVSHVVMEHSSIVKFIEWNWVGKTGLLKARDAEVNNLGSLLDPKATGVAVPVD
jgi:phospholipase C